MHREAEPPVPHRVSRRLGLDVALGLALLVGFSITLQNLALHWLLHPWSRYSLAYTPLVAWAIYREGPGDRAFVRLGMAVVGLGLIVQLVAAKGDVVVAARPILGTTAAAFFLMRGIASPRCATLALWIVPIPQFFVTALGGAAVANFLFGIGAGLFAPFGVDVIIEPKLISAGLVQLPIESIHGGYVSVVHMLGLGWFYTMRRGLGLADSARTMALFALCAAPIQLAGVLAAALALAVGSPGTAKMLLELATWLLPLVAVVWLTERRTSPPRKSLSENDRG